MLACPAHCPWTSLWWDTAQRFEGGACRWVGQGWSSLKNLMDRGRSRYCIDLRVCHDCVSAGCLAKRGDACRALETVLPLTSLQAPGGLIPVVLMLGPSGLCNCFDVFHPFYHHIFFSSPFCRMLLRSKNSKSTAPLTLISMPRCVLCCQDFSASFLQAVLSPGSSRLPSVPSGSSHWCLLQRLPRPVWEWKLRLPWAWFCFKIHTNSGRLGTFPGMSEKPTSGERDGAILFA